MWANIIIIIIIIIINSIVIDKYKNVYFDNILLYSFRCKK